MLKNKILYFITIIISVIFFILYTEPFSLYLMIFILTVPAAMALCVIIAGKTISADIEASTPSAVKNEKIQIGIRIKNRSPLPFTNCYITVEYYNNLVEYADYAVVSIPVHGRCSEKVNLCLVSDYCGMLNVRIDSVQVYDPINLFSRRIKPSETLSVTILPEILPLKSSHSYDMTNSDDSDVFSKSKGGDDPSEIFALQNYVQGDKPNRIHWKLSLKHDDLIVRHYSQPINTSILLILDFTGFDADALDTTAETAFSIAFFLIENDIPFKFAYYSQYAQKDMTVSISDEKDIIPVMSDIFREGPLEKSGIPKLIGEFSESYSNIFFVSPSERNMSQAIREASFPELRPIFINSEQNISHTFDDNNEVTVIPAGKNEQFISGIVI